MDTVSRLQAEQAMTNGQMGKFIPAKTPPTHTHTSNKNSGRFKFVSHKKKRERERDWSLINILFLILISVNFSKQNVTGKAVQQVKFTQ